jgi:hypothetical protein
MITYIPYIDLSIKKWRILSGAAGGYTPTKNQRSEAHESPLSIIKTQDIAGFDGEFDQYVDSERCGEFCQLTDRRQNIFETASESDLIRKLEIYPNFDVFCLERPLPSAIQRGSRIIEVVIPRAVVDESRFHRVV